MNQILQKIILPQVEFEAYDNSQKFLKTFCDLYRIELFKDGLDLILTKLKERHLKFEVKVTKGWDTNVGCFLTEHRGVYDQTVGKFFRKLGLKIILRQLSYNVMAHEMAHALEFESGLDLGQEFRTAIGYDMKNRDPSMLTLKAQKDRLMIEALKSYPPQQFISELFARYFELLSISRNVCANGDFTTEDVMGFFINTTKFLREIFNPAIRSKIDPEIAEITEEIAKEVRLSKPEVKFQDRIESVKQRAGGAWSKSVKSNSMWQQGWKKYQEIEEKK